MCIAVFVPVHLRLPACAQMAQRPTRSSRVAARRLWKKAARRPKKK